MPQITFHRNGTTHVQEIKPNENLVVLAGVRKFPNLKYGCGMGKCTKCMSKIISGGDQLPPPNWKEEKMLGERLKDGYRLTCQLFISHDLELEQEG